MNDPSGLFSDITEHPMPKVAIVGNCQAQALETIFMMHTDWQIIRVPPVFNLDDSRSEEVSTALADADIIFAQRIADDYAVTFLRTSSLKAEFSQVISWPNIYFSGYFPDVQYIYKPGIGKVIGPLDDYHLRMVHYFHSQRKSVEQCVALYSSTEFDQYYPEPIESSLSELTKREEGLDLTISGRVQESFAIRKLFYTVNHPSNLLLFDMADLMMRSQGQEFQRPRFHPYALSRINIPIYPRIRDRHSLILPEGSFVGISRHNLNVDAASASPKVYEDWHELVTAFYQFYDSMYVGALSEKVK